MPRKPTRAETVGIIAMFATFGWFSLVVSYWWIVDPQLPNSKLAVLSVVGLSVAGAMASAVLSMFVCFLLLPIFRVRSRARLASSAAVWLIFCAIAADSLYRVAGDPQRFWIATAIFLVSGLMLGPFYGNMIVGMWWLKRREKEIDAELAIKKAEIAKDSARKMVELRRKLAADRAQGENERERKRALLNYFRS